MEEPSSKQLIARCVEGDARAKTLVVDRYRTRLLELAQKGVGNRRKQIEPESIVNEVFLRFLRLAESGRLQWQFEGGLWRLLSRMTALRLKEKHRDVRDPRRTARGGSHARANQDLRSKQNYDHTLLQVMEEFRELMSEYRRQLSSERRLIFDRWLSGESSLVIGNAVGCSDRTIRRMLEKIRGELSHTMDERFES